MLIKSTSLKYAKKVEYALDYTEEGKRTKEADFL